MTIGKRKNNALFRKITEIRLVFRFESSFLFITHLKVFRRAQHFQLLLIIVKCESRSLKIAINNGENCALFRLVRDQF